MKSVEQSSDLFNSPENECEGLPSFIKNWNQMYFIVIGTLLVLIVLFYAMMRYFE